MPTLSVIIPTLNESANLPRLLDTLRAQTRPPDEIIVADAGSKDGTVELAAERGARVVPGGMPGPGRNAGARAAQGEIFLFLDADVLPPQNFIELALAEFEQTGFMVATCPTEALSDELTDKIIMDATNLYLQIIIPVSPRAPGFCIFARSEVHRAINGFDETLKMSEDHDYVRRASRHGKFGLLTSTRIPVSMRRLEKEGIVGLALKYLWCEMYALAGKPIHSMPFEYEFGGFDAVKSSKKWRLVDVSELRSLLGKMESPILHLSSAGLDQFRRVAEFDPLEFTERRVHLFFKKHDLAILKRYLRKRLELSRVRKSLASRIGRLKASASAEIIHIIDNSWFHLPFSEDDGDDLA